MDSLEDSFEKRVVFAVDFVSDNDVIEVHSSSMQFSSENACLLQEDARSGPTSQRVGGCRGKVLDVQSSSAAAGNLYPFQNERTLRRGQSERRSNPIRLDKDVMTYHAP